MGLKASQEAVSREQQRFFIGSTEIPGVQSVRAEYTNNAALAKYLGFSKYKHIPRGPQLGDISVSTLLITDDIFLNLTGSTGFNGYIVKQDNSQSLAFRSGFLTSYASRYSFGSLPQLDLGISVLGNLGNFKDGLSNNDLSLIASSNSNLQLKIPGPGCISLNIDEFSTNRIISYDINIQCNRNPAYGLGGISPFRVNSITPLEVTCSFQIEVNDYEMKNLRQYPFNEKSQAINLSIKTFDTDQVITSYSFDNMFMLGEAYETSINSRAGVAVQYKGFI